MLNYNALELVDEAVEFADELNIRAVEYENGSTVLDFGVEASGGIEAGLYYADISAGGLLSVSVRTDELNGTPTNFVDTWIDNPALGLIGAQQSGWEVDYNGYEAVCGGPGRVLARKPPETYELLDYEEDSDFAVVCLEANDLPSPGVMERIAEECGVTPEATYAVVAPLASTAGVFQMGARTPEIAVLRLKNLGYDIRKIETASGVSPVAPVVSTELDAMGVTNDSVRYCGRAHLRVREDSDVFGQVPTSETEFYDTFFTEVLEEYGGFYEVDDSVFAPASVTVDVIGGDTKRYGEVDEQKLSESYGIET
ncbi:MAG: methenyltetrahydromethanopterin cyclohydrolase [Halobacteria archaeon]|nr:methenyltetrahydromethanopterin cyclohydrolase [Halobacteria archaeon]